MPLLQVDLPKNILQAAIDQAMSLRSRQIKAASNELIKEALEQELATLSRAKSTITEIKNPK